MNVSAKIAICNVILHFKKNKQAFEHTNQQLPCLVINPDGGNVAALEERFVLKPDE